MEIVIGLIVIAAIYVVIIIIGKSKGAPDPEYMQDSALVSRLKTEESWLIRYRNMPYENQQSKSLKTMREEKLLYVEKIKNEIIKREKAFENKQSESLRNDTIFPDEPDLIITEKTIAEAKNGDNRVQFLVGSGYLAGSNGLRQDLEKAHYYLRKAAGQDHALASFVLAGLYAEGTGVSQDLEEANIWALKAKVLGFPDADNMLHAID